MLAVLTIRRNLAFVTEATPRHGPGNVGGLRRAEQPGWRGRRWEGVGGTLMRYARSTRLGREALKGQPEGESEPRMSIWRGTRSKSGDDHQNSTDSDRRLHFESYLSSRSRDSVTETPDCRRIARRVPTRTR